MNGPCAKRVVTCRIEYVHPSGDVSSVEATNWCANPQPVCPRVPGEDYTKCRTICQQGGHAEMIAIALAKKHGIARGAHARITGHYWMCEACGRELRDAGVRSVTIIESAMEELA